MRQNKKGNQKKLATKKDLPYDFSDFPI